MDKIELTKDEVIAVLNALSEFPYKLSAHLIHFFNQKLQQKLEPQKEDVVPGKGE